MISGLRSPMWGMCAIGLRTRVSRPRAVPGDTRMGSERWDAHGSRRIRTGAGHRSGAGGRPLRILAVAVQKGGTGKTTLAASLAIAAAEAGEHVTALDLDPQGSLAGWGALRRDDSVAVDRVQPWEMGQLSEILG